MADRGKARGRVQVWRPWGVARPPILGWPSWPGDITRSVSQRLGIWVQTDIGAGRLVPWIAICYGLGIVLYFTADREPELWSAIPSTVAAVGAAVLARKRPLGFPMAVALAAIVAGFATGSVRRAIIDH